MSNLEKIIDLLVNDEKSPLHNFANTINSDKEYLDLKEDKKRWNRIHEISYHYDHYKIDVYKELKNVYYEIYPRY